MTVAVSAIPVKTGKFLSMYFEITVLLQITWSFQDNHFRVDIDIILYGFVVADNVFNSNQVVSF